MARPAPAPARSARPGAAVARIVTSPLLPMAVLAAAALALLLGGHQTGALAAAAAVAGVSLSGST
jgi:hypothetical protein